MKYFIAILFLLVPSIAMSQEMNKKDMVGEFRDIATLIAAQVLDCGVTDKKKILKFNSIFDSFMLYSAKLENIDLTQEEIYEYKMSVLIEQYIASYNRKEEIGCQGLNAIIDNFDTKMRYTDSVYNYYEPFDTL